MSDQGANYQSDLVNELFEVLYINRLKTTPYHPECDGLSERDNRTNKAALTSLVNDRMDDWDTKLQFIQFAYNTSVNATTKCTPFELMYGRAPRLPLDLILPEVDIDLQLTQEQYASEVKATLENAYELIKNNRDCKMDKNKFNHDRKARAANYETGDQVLLISEAKKKGTSNKLC